MRLNAKWRTRNARRGQASLQFRTDVGLLASLYPRRAGAPFSLRLSFSLFYLFSSPPFYRSIFPLYLSFIRGHAIARLSLSQMYPLLLHHLPLRCLPSSCASLPYLAPTLLAFLPLQLFTGSTASISFHLAVFELSFSLRSIPRIIFYLPSSARPSLQPAPFLFHFRLLSLSCSILRRSSISPLPTFLLNSVCIPVPPALCFSR